MTLPTWPFRALIVLGIAVASVEFLLPDRPRARRRPRRRAMTGIEVGVAAVAGLVLLIAVGMPIGVAMLFVSFGGVAGSATRPSPTG